MPLSGLLPSGGGGAEFVEIQASEALIPGPVNVWSDDGALRVRKASASSLAKRASGFVKVAVLSGGTAQVYVSGLLTGLTGLTQGEQWLGETAGSFASTAPVGAGKVVQYLGIAPNATSILFWRGLPIERV